MDILKNKYRGTGLQLAGVPLPSDDAAAPLKLLGDCPIHKPTPLVNAMDLAVSLGIGTLHVKDERTRMGLGSFKALGAAYVVAHMAAQSDITGLTFVTASAGNHGLSVAAGARIFGAKSVVYISDHVPEGFAQRLAEKGAQVIRTGDDYEASMIAAQQAAADNGWFLLSDTSWDEYIEPSHRLMEGYTVMAHEIAQSIPKVPSHIFLQAGVGGLACAMARYMRKVWGDAPKMIVVEPSFAPALIESIRAGKVINTVGPVSNMGRLDCKEPSLIALAGLALDADYFVTLEDADCAQAVAKLSEYDLESSTSGGAGVAALMLLKDQLGIDETSDVLCILSEGADG